MALPMKSLDKKSRTGTRRTSKLELARYVAEPSATVALAAILHLKETAAMRAAAWTRFEAVGWDEV